MVRRNTSTLLRASLTASSFEGWMMARISFIFDQLFDVRCSLSIVLTLTGTFHRYAAVVEVTGIHRIVGKVDGVIGLESFFDVGHHAFVIGRLDMQRFAKEILADLAFFDHDFAALDDIARQLEHGFYIGARCVDRYIAVRAGAEVAFVFKPENAGRAGARADGDLVKRVFAVEVLEDAAFEHAPMNAFQRLLPVGPVHEQLPDFGIGQKGAAVGMVRAHGHAPWVLDEQVPFQANGPLQGVYEALVLVFDWHDAAAGFHFGVDVSPAMASDFVKIVAKRAVAGHRGGFAEKDLADIHG